MSKKLDPTHVAVIVWLMIRAAQGDERVLRIAEEKAAAGSPFAKALLEWLASGQGVGAKE